MPASCSCQSMINTAKAEINIDGKSEPTLAVTSVKALSVAQVPASIGGPLLTALGITWFPAASPTGVAVKWTQAKVEAGLALAATVHPGLS